MAYTGPIDMNRGVMYCSHPKAHFRIFMYIDTPGVYMDEHARPVPETLAAEAGFAVERYRKMKLLNEERAKFENVMKEQLQMDNALEVYKEVDGLRLILVSDTGLAYIERDGTKLYPTPIPLTTALALFEQFVEDAKGKVEGVKEEPGIANSTEASPSPPPTSPSATKGSKVGAAAMLK